MLLRSYLLEKELSWLVTKISSHNLKFEGRSFCNIYSFAIAKNTKNNTSIYENFNCFIASK